MERQPPVFCLELLRKVRGRRQAHNPTLAKIMRLAYDRSHSHNRPQTAACNAVYSISRRALLITRLGEQLPRPRQVSMLLVAAPWVLADVFPQLALWGEKFASLSAIGKKVRFCHEFWVTGP